MGSLFKEYFFNLNYFGGFLKEFLPTASQNYLLPSIGI
jgi:hypothetical protein